MSEAFKEQLLDAMALGLPGEAAHLPMMPTNRPLSNEALKSLTNYRSSAVAVIILELEEHHQVILIQRPTYDGAHSGQVAFPGGKMEESDTDHEFTARRECFEEIGFRLRDEHYIGKLTDVYIPVSGFLMHPHLYFVKEEISFVADSREVDEILLTDLSLLMQEEVRISKTLEIAKGANLKNVPGFEIEGRFIWGATSLVLNELLHLLQRVRI